MNSVWILPSCFLIFLSVMREFVKIRVILFDKFQQRKLKSILNLTVQLVVMSLPVLELVYLLPADPFITCWPRGELQSCFDGVISCFCNFFLLWRNVCLSNCCRLHWSLRSRQVTIILTWMKLSIILQISGFKYWMLTVCFLDFLIVSMSLCVPSLGVHTFFPATGRNPCKNVENVRALMVQLLACLVVALSSTNILD